MLGFLRRRVLPWLVWLGAASMAAWLWMDLRSGPARGYVEAPIDTVATGLTDSDDRIVVHRGAANFPWVSHAEHTLVQMRRWAQIDAMVDIAAVAARVFRPDLYRPR